MRRLLSSFVKILSRDTARQAKPVRRTILRMEQLEDRLVPTAGIREQYMLELVNRMRENPSVELTRILAANDADVNNALSYFGVDKNVLAQQWSSLMPAAPLAWNDDIAEAALGHSQNMLSADLQSHQLPGEANIGQRMINAGWNVNNASWLAYENIYAYADSVFAAHAALAIDWGNGPSGIQSPAGHRTNLMDPRFQEIGIGMVDATAGKQTGPLLITQDFGYRSTVTPYLLGVVYKDTNHDGFYSQGEGLSNVTLSVTGAGGSFTITTSLAGGYQLQVPAGSYTVTATGGGLAAPLSSNVTIGNANVHLAFVAPEAAAPTTPTITGPTVGVKTGVAPVITWSASAGAVRYELWVDNLTTGQREVVHLTNLTTTSAKTAILPMGNYRAWVKAYNSANLGSAWSGSWTFSVGAPVVSKMTAPTSANTATAPKFTWTASTGALRYELWVDNLTTGQREVIHLNNLTTTSYVHANGLAAGNYRVWVRAWGKLDLTNGWSNPLNFTVTSVAPVTPKITKPTSATTVTLTQFAWTASLGATRYELWINNTTTGQQQVIYQPNLTATSFTATNLLTAGSYKTWVRAFNSMDQASAWTSLAFTVKGAAPAVPTVTAPTSATTDAAPKFTWTSSLGAARYEIWVDNLSTGVRQVISQKNLTTTNFTPATALAAGNYRVWVRAFDSTGLASAWSLNRDFTVTASVPAPVNLGPQVVAFAAGKLGQQVGGGECAHLVEAALQAAGAKTTQDYGVTGLDADYVWGDLVATYHAGDNAAILANLRAGDIIQYRNVTITEGFSSWSFPHHTSIIEANLGGGKVKLLEQNVNGERWVHETTVNLAAMTGGTIWIYRPAQK